MSQLANASATSLNFIGFEDQRGQGMPEILYNQVFIEPNQSYTAGVGSLAAAGFVPGTQSYLKRRQAIWSQTSVGRQLAGEGFEYSFSAPLTMKQIEAKFQSETGGGLSGDLAWGQAMPRPSVQGDESGFTHQDEYVARGFFP
mgnify:CR=1 FL=1